ncbi:MAG TPA: anti-sigma factor [Vicinamibacteria bacterium]|jgi:anti-sigma-K factor RskA|nr:anti-sigma factor [Vicinamibacteria bacterium]
MTDDRLLELAPLAALGALDGEDRAYFEERLAGSEEGRRELAAFETVADRIGLATPPVPPAPHLRRRIFAAVARPAGARRAWIWPVLAAAAALVLSLGSLVMISKERSGSRRAMEAARAEADTMRAQLQKSREELDAARRRLADEKAFRDLLASPDARVTSLAGLAAAPQAHARVVWNPGSREAVLLVSGLTPAPAGKTYEIWVIAKSPVPAGVFQVDAEGGAVFRLPMVDDMAGVKTFAVTLEITGGVPSPSGPMVLAGAAS